jgi:hypothetical protein
LTLGEAHAREKVTVRVSCAGTVALAETAAPIDDPWSDGLVDSIEPRWSKDPCCQINSNISGLILFITKKNCTYSE